MEQKNKTTPVVNTSMMIRLVQTTWFFILSVLLACLVVFGLVYQMGIRENNDTRTGDMAADLESASELTDGTAEDSVGVEENDDTSVQDKRESIEQLADEINSLTGEDRLAKIAEVADEYQRFDDVVNARRYAQQLLNEATAASNEAFITQANVILEQIISVEAFLRSLSDEADLEEEQ